MSRLPLISAGFSMAVGHPEAPGALFDQGVAWLRRSRVLLPGMTVLTRLITSVRHGAAGRMYRSLADAAAAADPGLAARLQGLLQVPDGQRVSELERQCRAPRRISGRSMALALDRVSEMLALGARAANVDAVPPSRLAVPRPGNTPKSARISGIGTEAGCRAFPVSG